MTTPPAVPAEDAGHRDVTGSLFAVVEQDAIEVLADLEGWVAVVNDPPWSNISATLPAPARVISAWDMDITHLDTLVNQVPGEAEVIVGIGGGTAMDTAKYLAWKGSKRLVQVPSIASVDAGFTDAVGVRADRLVKYVGSIRPDFVVVDFDLMRTAPLHLNRAGIGDVLSCHTGLADWQLAVSSGQGYPWNESAAALGRQLLDELESAAEEICATTDDGLRMLTSAYNRVGAMGTAVGHARFEEGSEHFFAYAFEHLTGAHPVHGEIISFAVMAMATVQGNNPDRARKIIETAQVRANPADLGISFDDFSTTLRGLSDFCRQADLWWNVVNEREVTDVDITSAWTAVSSISRR